MKFKKILFIITCIVTTIILFIYNAFCVNPYQLKVREEYIVSKKLDKTFDGFTIVFFSDLHYGMIDDDFLDKTISYINEFDPDIVIFGGDLVDHYSNNPLNEIQREYLTNSLKNIKTSSGKFAVLGNHDLDSDNTKNAITNILSDADFEIITNKNFNIYNSDKKYFKLIGIDSLALGSPDINEAFDNVDETSFNLTVCHTPDIFDDLPKTSDYLLAGHSHGGQIYLSLLTSLYTPYGSQKYYHGIHNNDGKSLDITNGVGMTNKKIRFAADAEIVVYQLKSN